jgi:branched-chain amino acid transport system substrate-binding protein
MIAFSTGGSLGSIATFGQAFCVLSLSRRVATMSAQLRVGRRALVALATGSVLVLASACASSGGGGAGGSAGGKAPIKIVTDGLWAGGIPEQLSAIQAEVDAINAGGGIQGRKLDLIVCDDKNDPNKAIQCVQSAISQGVVAMVSEASASFGSFEPLLKQAGIASIATNPSDLPGLTSPISFPINGSVPAAFLSLARLLKKSGAKKVSFIYQSDLGSASAGLKTSFEAGAKAAGVQVVNTVGIPGTTSDFGPAVATALKGGTQGLATYMSGLGQGEVIEAVRQQNPTIPLAATTFSLTANVLKALGSAGDGLDVVGVAAPANSKVPGAAMYRADMAKYEPTAGQTDQAMVQWAGVWLFDQIASKLKVITKQTVLQAMNNLKNFNLGGIVPPLTTQNCTTCGGMTRLFNPYAVYDTLKGQAIDAQNPGQFVNVFSGQVVTVGS